MFMKEIVRLRNAGKYSWQGAQAAWRDAGAFRTEICLTPFIALLAFHQAGSRAAFGLLLASWLLVLMAELLNTGIEAATDLACKGEIHPLAKKAKDCASAAVALALVVFALVWATIAF